jgi:hypothetical protein
MYRVQLKFIADGGEAAEAGQDCAMGQGGRHSGLNLWLLMAAMSLFTLSVSLKLALDEQVAARDDERSLFALHAQRVKHQLRNVLLVLLFFALLLTQCWRFLRRPRYVEVPAICCICLDQPVSMIVRPCNHCCACARCVKRLHACPLCRESVDEIEPIYIG